MHIKILSILLLSLSLYATKAKTQKQTEIKFAVDSICSLGNKYRDNGDFYLADLYYTKALFVLQNQKIEYPETKAYIFYLMGNNYSCQKEYDKAIESFNKSIHTYKYTNSEYLGRLYTDLAYTHALIGQNKMATKYYKQAIDFFQKNIDKYNYELSIAYKSFGLICKNNQELQQSENLFLKSHEIVKKYYTKNKTILANSLNYIGFFYYETNQYEKALQYFQKSINTIIPQTNATKIYSNPKPEDLKRNTELLYALRRKARTLYLLYLNTKNIKDLKASFTTFELVMSLIEKTRDESFSEESDLTFADNYKETINYAIITIYKLYKLTGKDYYKNKLFEYSEKGKASLLFRSIKEIESFQKDTNFVRLKKLDKKLQPAIEIINNTNRKQTVMINKLMKLHDEVESFTKTHFKTYSNIASNNKSITLDSLQQKLNADELVLEYSLTDSILFCFIIQKNKTEIATTPVSQSFQGKLAEYLQLISNPDKVNWEHDFYKFASLSRFLYNILIYPAENKIKHKRLVIIPDNELQYIPFETLIIDDSLVANDYKNLHYLCYYNPISYSYSANLRFNNNHVHKPKEKKLLAIAPDYSLPVNKKSQSINARNRLTKIRYANTEAEKIAGLFKGEYICGNTANEQFFKQNASQYEILHLAMHTNINDKNPLLSKFFFTFTNNRKQDDCLNTYELFNMHIDADLVVLSCCKTGMGKMYNGEGLYNLARGFISAGCHSILLTLWDSSDNSANKIILLFYENIKNQMPKDIALQKAKKDYLKNTIFMEKAHPYYWAGYLQTGNTGKLKKLSSFNKFYLKILLSLMIFSTVFFLFLKKRKKSN